MYRFMLHNSPSVMEVMVQPECRGCVSRPVKSWDILVMKLFNNTSLKSCPCIEQHVTNFKVLDLSGLVVFFVHSMSMY